MAIGPIAHKRWPFRTVKPWAFCAGLAALLLASTWFAGGQNLAGRLDPALTLPWMMPILLLLSYHWRGVGWAAYGRGLIAFLILLLVMQIAMLFIWAEPRWDAVPAQLAVVAGGLFLAAIIARMTIVRMRRRPAWGAMMAALLLPLWFVSSHAALSHFYRLAPADSSAQPTIMMTSLPLRWSGSDDFTAILAGASVDDPALRQLEALGPLMVVDRLDGLSLNPKASLLLLHPRALTPQDLVAVDAHIGSGGRAVILADALSSWPLPHALGDGRNPPITSLLTPLLDHWGIRLDAVPHGKEANEVRLFLSGKQLRLMSAGRFSAMPDSCQAMGGGFVLNCTMGRGEIWLVGDADLLQAAVWQGDAMGAPYLTRSEIWPWLGDKIWGHGAGRAILQPLWIR